MGLTWIVIINIFYIHLAFLIMSDYKIKYLSVFMSIVIMGFFINDIVIDYYEAAIKGWVGQIEGSNASLIKN